MRPHFLRPARMAPMPKPYSYRPSLWRRLTRHASPLALIGGALLLLALLGAAFFLVYAPVAPVILVRG